MSPRLPPGLLDPVIITDGKSGDIFLLARKRDIEGAFMYAESEGEWVYLRPMTDPEYVAYQRLPRLQLVA